MKEINDTNNQAIQSQYYRLGFFLTASSFLVVAFITLVTTEKDISVLLTHAVATLGSITSLLYTFMNWWAARELGKKVHLVHTYIIPFLFFLFWIVAWNIVALNWPSWLMVLIFPLLWWYQRKRS